MNWIRSLALAAAMATWTCAAQTTEPAPEADTGGSVAPAATLTLVDGSTVKAKLLGADGGLLHISGDGQTRCIPLTAIGRLVFDSQPHFAELKSPAASDGGILEQLLKIVVHNEPFGARRHRPLSAFHVEGMLKGGYRLYSGKYRQMLSPPLLSALLEAADDPERRWLVIGPLAAMYRIGRADELPRLPTDESVSIARRVVAAAALYRVGEPVAVDKLCTLFAAADESDLKMVLVWLLGRSKDRRAVEMVVGCLCHPDEELQEVAATAAGSQQAPEAAEPLARIIRQRWKASKDATFIISALGQIKARYSARLLVGLIDDVRESTPESHVLQQLVWAFGSVTGERFSGKTYADSARMALQWWYEEK